MKKPTLEEIREIIELVMDEPVPDLALDSNIYEEGGIDSLGAVAMVIEIQRRFKVRIDDGLIPKLLTPRALIEVIVNNMDSQGMA